MPKKLIYLMTCTTILVAYVLLAGCDGDQTQTPPTEAEDANGGKRGYKIALSFPDPPWGVGPLEGVNFDLLSAICAANTGMRCTFLDRPSTDCVDSDAEGNLIIGRALAEGQVDGCMGWFITSEREQLGAEFSNPYSRGPTPQLIASNSNDAFDDLGASGSLGGAEVGFLRGFFNDPSCLGRHYTDFSQRLFETDQVGRDSMVVALLNDSIDLAFWNNVETVPNSAHIVGAPVLDCGANLAMLVFPHSAKRRNESDMLRRDFNCGLALIRANGVMVNLCANSPHPGGDPACILEGPPPTVQCLADNPTADAG